MRTPEELEHMDEISKGLPHNLEGLIEKLLDPDPEVRLQVTSRLMNLEDTRAVPHLIRALDDESSRVRAIVALAIGHYEPQEAVKSLLEHLKNDSNGDVRALCGFGLGRIGCDEVMEALVSSLKDPDHHVRISVASVFARNGDKRAINELLMLLEDSNSHVRYAACDALVMLSVGDNRIVEAILKLKEDAEMREMSDSFAAADIMMRLFDEHPETLDMLDKIDKSVPEADNRERLDLLRERLGEAVVPKPSDDPLLDLADRARKLLDS